MANLDVNKNWENLGDDANTAVNTLKKQILAATEGSLAEIDYLKSALQLYKQAVIQSIDSNMEAADIIAKYANYQSMSGMNSSYNLPGVFDSSVNGVVNVDSMKADNQKLMQNNELKNSVDKQRDMAFKMVVQNYNDLKQKLNTLAQSNQAIFEYIAGINEKIQN